MNKIHLSIFFVLLSVQIIPANTIIPKAQETVTENLENITTLKTKLAATDTKLKYSKKDEKELQKAKHAYLNMYKTKMKQQHIAEKDAITEFKEIKVIIEDIKTVDNQLCQNMKKQKSLLQNQLTLKAKIDCVQSLEKIKKMQMKKIK